MISTAKSGNTRRSVGDRKRSEAALRLRVSKILEVRACAQCAFRGEIRGSGAPPIFWMLHFLNFTIGAIWFCTLRP